MAEKQVTIRISAQDQFSAVIQKYQQAMGQAATSTQKLNTASGDAANGGLTGLNNTLNNLMGVFAGIKILNVVGDLVTLGGAANATAATFNALNGGVAEATNTLNAMRAATGGVVADTDLMAGANRLLAMRIAESGKQAADLAAVAVNLGRAFGQDASSAIENFSLMIANQSLLRLDSLGISAAAVRARMAELKDEFPEMDKQARFTQATLEQATKTVDRLGTSITAAQTPIAKLETSFENLKTKTGQVLADILNTAITTFDQLAVVIEHGLGTTLQMSPEQQAATVDSARSFAETWGEEFGARVGTLGMPADFNGGQMLQRIEEARMALGAGASSDALVQKAGEDMWYSQAQIDRMKQVYAFIQSEAPRMAEQNLRMRASEMSRFSGMLGAAGGGDSGGFFGGGGFGQLTPSGNAGMGAGGFITDFLGGTTKSGRQGYADDKMFQFEHNTAGIGQFMDPAGLDDIRARFEELKELNEQGLITDDNLAKAEKFKSSAEAAAQAFENMSLTDIFGQSSGGIQGQIGDMVMSKLKDTKGIKPEQLDAIQQTFDLSSGRETQSSIAFNEQVIPMLQQLALQDPELAAQAIKNFEAASKQAAVLGIDQSVMANNIMGFTGMTGGQGSSFTVAPWQQTNAQGTLAGNASSYSPEMAKAFKEKYGIDLTPETFSALSGMGTSTQFRSEDIQPQIQSTMLDEMMKANTVNGFSAKTKDQILGDPAFIKAVQDATAATVAQLNAPAPAGGAGGMSTLSEISASTGIPVSQLLAATGAASPNLVQPGTYSTQGYSASPGFNPLGYAQGLAGGYGVPGGGAAGANPFVSAGFMSQGAFDASVAGHGEAAGGADPSDKMKDMETSSGGLADNMKAVADQMLDIDTKATSFNDTLDLAAKSREMTFTVNLKDNTKGLLELLLNEKHYLNLNMSTVGTRDNGGRVPGMQPSSNQRPGIP